MVSNDKRPDKEEQEDRRQRMNIPSPAFPPSASPEDIAEMTARLRAQFESQAEEAKRAAGAMAMPDYWVIKAAYMGDIRLMWAAKGMGANLGTAEADTGLTAVHIAAGIDDLAMLRYLIEEEKIGLSADRFGRWPSIVAAECRASVEVIEYLADAEAKDEPRQPAQA